MCVGRGGGEGGMDLRKLKMKINLSQNSSLKTAEILKYSEEE